MIRTQEEIVKRIEEIKDEDLFGFQTGDLIIHLDYEAAKLYLKDETTEKEWKKLIDSEREDTREELTNYFPFAYEKCVDHRGLSASRSISHYQAWTWLLGDYDEFPWLHYANYGAPILKKIAEFYEIELPDWNREEFARMAMGKTCREEGCDEGCGSG